tara:strand:- start:236 stop:1483 length:1248 start_codon:yes stop_codon:yes gene_type:complete
MTRSKQFLLDDKSFITETEGNTATVIRTSTGKELTQTEIEEAGDFYNIDLKEIDYAKIYNLDFGADFIGKLGASDEWMAKALTDKTYKEVFKKALSKNSSNVSFVSPETSNIFQTLSNNTDANGGSNNKRGTILRYPLNQDKKSYDYLKVCAYEYKPRGFGDGGQGLTGDYEDKGLNKKSTGNHTAYLPMEAAGLQESNNVSWGDDRINALEAAAANIAGGTITGAAEGLGPAFKNLMSGSKEGFDELFGPGKVNENDVAAFFAGQAVGKNVFTRATGKVMNPNLELLFSGPNLRSFAYSFRFTPREEAESRVVRSIIKMFKKAMAPRRKSGKLFLESPHVFKLKYYYNNGEEHPFLNKIKTCALQSFNVQYAPDGSYMTYEDGSMTSYTINMTFGELNPIYEDDIDEDSNDMGF